MQKVYLETNGCAVLRHETYKIAKYIRENSYEEVDNPSEADYIIITGCGVIKTNEDYILGLIKRLYEEHKDHAKIIVAGCIPTISNKLISEISSDIIQINNDKMEEFDNYFYKDKKLNDINYNINPYRHHSSGDPQLTVSQEELDDLEFVKKIDEITNSSNLEEQFRYSTRGRHLWREPDLFEIRVAYGCSSNCSYCITRKAIGNFKSVPEDIILSQAKEANKMGYNRIMLMGDEIGAWNYNGKNITDLVADILTINPNFRIGIRYVHPDIIVKYYDKFIPYFENGSIYYFCAAFQSGSSKILKLMNRNPNIEPFIKCMEDMAQKDYPVFRHTQIIVGFPYETDEDFFETIIALQRSSFDHVTISSYSKREGTKSYDFEELPSKTIEKRTKLLDDWLKLNRANKILKAAENELNGFSRKLKKGDNKYGI